MAYLNLASTSIIVAKQMQALSLDEQSTHDAVISAPLCLLPNELKFLIAGFVDDPASLINLAMTSKAFYRLIQDDEAKLSRELCLRRIGVRALPIALARVYFSIPTGRPLRDKDGIPSPPPPDFVDTVNLSMNYFLQPQDLDSFVQQQTFTLILADELVSFHDVVSGYARIVERSALSWIRKTRRLQLSTSEGEMNRIRKSLYIFQLVSDLFPGSTGNSGIRYARETSAGGPAWDHFWETFAPWELQQTRCAHEILAAYIGRFSQRKDAKTLRAFVLNKGLVQLRHLENQGTQALTEAFCHFSKLRSDLFRSMAWHHKPDTLYLTQEDQYSLLDASGILAQYPDDDSGPKDAWLHTLLQSQTIDDSRLNYGRIHVFRCGKHATRWGFVFWDRRNLDVISNASLPATEELEEISSYEYEYTSDIDELTTHRRESRACICAPLLR